MTTPVNASRRVGASIFADKSSPEPLKTGSVTWSRAVAMHASRDVRPDKDGPMLGGYVTKGKRCNADIAARALVQLDIDSEGDKDKTTGRVLKVTRTAPALDEIRSGIGEFEHCAVSSHWHEPQRGVIKYRIVILPDRDILPEELEPVLEALDGRLHGALDRGAWSFSQAFYLPSCPAENEQDAFFVHNEGLPLPVDEFVYRGREIIAKRADKTRLGKLGSNLSQAAPPPSETPENVERAKSMLAAISPDIQRPEWRQICWAVMATGWACAETVIREWSTRGETFTEKDFDGVVRSFDPTRGTGFGTLVHFARGHGWKDPSIIAAERFTGSGGDVKNGRIFAATFRNRLVHVYETGEWLLFDPRQGWVAAPPNEADRAAKEVLAMLRDYAADRWKAAPDDPTTKRLRAHVERTSNSPHLRAMIEMARSEPGMTLRLGDFDNDPMLIGVSNGVLDLRTSNLLAVSPGVLVSKRCNVAYDTSAVCPRFRQFLREVQPEIEMRRFLRILMGYCLTGCVDEQMFVFFHGLGANGKSVFVELCGWLLGDYSRKIQTEMLMHHQRNPQGPSPDIVSLKGTRFAYANETEEGRRLAEARVKELTGGDVLTGRVPYGKADISFRPSHKLIIVGNHKPEITDNSFGMWRRVVLAPFDQTIPDANRDPKLLETLKREGSGILNWMVAGLGDWRSNGLQVPGKIAAATASYRDELDVIGDWLGDSCVAGAGRSAKKSVLYANYTYWAKQNGHQPLAQGRLTRRLNERGYKLARDKRTVRGLALKPMPQPGCNI